MNLKLESSKILSPVDYGSEEAAMVRYREEGTQQALALYNRGPIRFNDEGLLDPAILESYSRCGFYIFEGVLNEEELQAIDRDLVDLQERAPVSKGAQVDHLGRPAFNASCHPNTILWAKPLSDQYGGSEHNYGRHPAKMYEPLPPAEAPEYVMQIVNGSLQFSEACLLVYGHPQLLTIAETILGEDFTPFNERLWIKQPRLGGSVAWHQDGVTHWDNPELDENTHGFNFMAQPYGCDAANGLWVVPGSHRKGKVDINALVEDAGSDRLPDAVPLICNPGDVVICNRQSLHASFANTSPQLRVTLNFGFHRRRSVLNMPGKIIENPEAIYDEKYIRERSRVIMYAIDARQKRFPHEPPFVYKPFAGQNETYRWTPEAKAGLVDYQLQDIRI